MIEIYDYKLVSEKVEAEVNKQINDIVAMVKQISYDCNFSTETLNDLYIRGGRFEFYNKIELRVSSTYKNEDYVDEVILDFFYIGYVILFLKILKSWLGIIGCLYILYLKKEWLRLKNLV